MAVSGMCGYPITTTDAAPATAARIGVIPTAPAIATPAGVTADLASAFSLAMAEADTAANNLL